MMPNLKKKFHQYSVQLHIIIFMAVFLILFLVINFIAQPIWTSHHNFDMTEGFYDEPENTIETILLGPSHMRCAISPMELYEKYGICSYNISTNAQPVLASYYWLEETYRLHPETLDTVVFDVEMVKKRSDSASNRLALDHMRLSTVKLNAVKAYSNDFTNFLYNLIPIFDYHERWKELTDQDFLKYAYKPELCIRGYHFGISQWINNVSLFSDINIPLMFDDNAEETVSNETSLKYLKKMVSFCEDHNIKLVLIKTPTYWSSSDHNAIQAFADKYDLDFLDFNIDPYFCDINFNIATDVMNTTDTTNLHLNYYGSLKLTDYMGNYLINECGNKDVRGNEKYTFLDEELEEYHRYIASAELLEYTDPCDYIEYVNSRGDYTTFISVKGDAAASLTKEQRDYFNSIGLKELSGITDRASYLAVIENGIVKTEMYSEDPGEEYKSDNPLEYSGSLPDGTIYTITSGGADQGNKSSIIIGGTERSGNSRGLNIVIYDDKQKKFAASAIFDTHVSPQREIQNVEPRLAAKLSNGVSLSELSGPDRTLYLYDRMCENDKNVKLIRQTVEEDDVTVYLDAFLNDADLDIYISVKDDASRAMKYNLRAGLARRGLTKLSQIDYQDSYVAFISGGDVIFEEDDHDENCIEVKNEKYYLASGGSEAGASSSIMIDGKEYSPNEDGINIVIYDNITEMVIDTISFDTGNVTQDTEETAA